MSGEQQLDADLGSGVEVEEFSWEDYLEETGSTTVPYASFKHVDIRLQNGFAPGMKLEVALKNDPETYWVATIITACEQLLLLRYEGYGEDRKADFWCDIRKAGLYPIGWCQQNKKTLEAPEGIRDKVSDWNAFLQQTLIGACGPPVSLLEGLRNGRNPLDLIAPGSKLECQDFRDSLSTWLVTVVENIGGRLKLLKNQLNSTHSVMINGKYCCPKIYFNHRCFSGPYLNKGRIAELPQCVGPGNCVLVLREVLTLLINAAYKPSRVLRELQLDKDSVWHGCGEVLKAKYKGKSYRATVEIVRTADRVTEFCRQTCIKLECCPNLFGPRMVLDTCSENCSVLTKNDGDSWTAPIWLFSFCSFPL